MTGSALIQDTRHIVPTGEPLIGWEGRRMTVTTEHPDHPPGILALVLDGVAFTADQLPSYCRVIAVQADPDPADPAPDCADAWQSLDHPYWAWTDRQTRADRALMIALSAAGFWVW